MLLLNVWCICGWVFGHPERHVRFVVAGRLWAWFLRRNGFWAIPMPWRTVYCLSEHIDDPVMRGHEMVHFEQMDREGTIRFCVKYLWFAWRYGYVDNPFEVEAYSRFSYSAIEERRLMTVWIVVAFQGANDFYEIVGVFPYEEEARAVAGKVEAERHGLHSIEVYGPFNVEQG